MSDDTVVPFDLAKKAQPAEPGPADGDSPPSAALIAALEEILKGAKAGEIVGMACTYCNKDWKATYHVVGFVGGFAMVGAAQCALQDLTDAARGITNG